MPRMKRVIFYISPEQYARLKELAQEQSRAGDRVSVAHLLREAVREWLGQWVEEQNSNE